MNLQFRDHEKPWNCTLSPNIQSVWFPLAERIIRGSFAPLPSTYTSLINIKWSGYWHRRKSREREEKGSGRKDRRMEGGRAGGKEGRRQQAGRREPKHSRVAALQNLLNIKGTGKSSERGSVPINTASQLLENWTSSFSHSNRWGGAGKVF